MTEEIQALQVKTDLPANEGHQVTFRPSLGPKAFKAHREREDLPVH